MDTTALEILVNGGLAGVAVVMIIYSGWKDKLNAETNKSIMQEVAKSLKEVADSQNKMADAFTAVINEIQVSNSNHENIKSVLSSNTKAMSQYFYFCETLIPEIKETFGLLKGFLNGLEQKK